MNIKTNTIPSKILVIMLTVLVLAATVAPYGVGVASAQTGDAYISGTVTNADGEPIRTQVIVEKNGTEVKKKVTNASTGSYSITLSNTSDNTTYTVRVVPNEYAEESKDITLSASESQTVNFEVTQKETKDYAVECKDLVARTTAMYPVDCFGDVTQNDVGTDNVTKLVALQNMESNAQFSQEVFTIFNNYAQDTEQVAFVEGRSAVAQAWESGLNESEAENKADNRINRYYRTKHVNILNVLNHVALNAGYANDEIKRFNYTAASDNPFVYQNVESKSVDGQTRTYIARPTGEYTTDEVIVKGKRVNVTVPHVEIFNYQDEEVIYSGPLYDGNVSSDINFDQRHVEVDTGTSDGTVNVSLAYTTSQFETSDGTTASRSVFDAGKFNNTWSEFESQNSNMQNNFDASLVNDSYTALNNGDIEPADLYGMNGLVYELSGDSTVTSDRFKMSMYRILNIGSPNLNETSSISGTYTGFTDTGAVYNSETQKRSVYNTEFVNKENVNGMIFTKNVTLSKGDKVVIDPLTQSEYLASWKEYSVTSNTSEARLHKNGEVVDTVQTNDTLDQDDGGVEFTPDGQLVLGYEEGYIEVYDVSNDTFNQTGNYSTGTQYAATVDYQFDNVVVVYGNNRGSIVNISDGSRIGAGSVDEIRAANNKYALGEGGELLKLNWSSESYTDTGVNIGGIPVFAYNGENDNQFLTVASDNLEKITYNESANTTSTEWSKTSATYQNSADQIGANHIVAIVGSNYNVQILTNDGTIVKNYKAADAQSYRKINMHYQDQSSFDVFISPAEFVDANSSNNEKTLNQGVFKVGTMEAPNGSTIPTVTNDTIDYILNDSATPNNTSQIVNDMGRFNSSDDIDGTDDVEAIGDYYGTDLSGAPINSQSWDGGANYSTTNTTEFAQEMEEIKNTIDAIRTYDDGLGDIGGIDTGILSQFLNNLGISGMVGVVVLVWFFFLRD